MKKILSLIMALMLLFSLTTVATAFAEEPTEGEEEQPARVVTVAEDVFTALEDITSLPTLHAAGNFQLNYDWLLDETTVKSVFVGAEYTLATPEEGEEEDTDKFAVAEGSDKVSVEYCSPSKDYKDENWSTTSPGKDISISASGWWNFRFVLKDADGEVLARTSYVSIYFSDEKAPVINDLSSDMKRVQEEGITVGSTYTIRTNLSINDTSSTTVTYVVYKYVKGAWTSEPIYDSKTKVVAEGYEDGISTSGVITMHEDDVLAGNSPVYKIVYTVTDAVGYVSATKEMTLFAKEAEDDAPNKMQVLQIVLYCVAAASAAAIVVLLLVKPKKATDSVNNDSGKSNK